MFVLLKYIHLVGTINGVFADLKKLQGMDNLKGIVDWYTLYMCIYKYVNIFHGYRMLLSLHDLLS